MALLEIARVSSWIIVAVVLASCGGILQTTGSATAQGLFGSQGEKRGPADPVLSEQILEQWRREHPIQDNSLPADVPSDLRARLNECRQTSAGDPQSFLNCQDAVREYDDFVCKKHVGAGTGPAYDQCRADLTERRTLNKLRAVNRPPEIRCRRESDDSVVCQ